jgi:hypothetical protein
VSFCRSACLTSAIILASHAAAWGQSIRAVISRTEASLDEVLTLQVQIKDPSQASAPIVPKTEDFDIRLRPGVANPAESVQQFFINGRYSRTATYTYTYDVTPKRAGSLTIPPFWMKDGGKQYKSAPIQVVVKTQSGPKLLFCKVVVERQTAYVGEPVRLRLEAWVHKYHQRGLGTLGADDMIRFANLGGSDFGIFRDSISGSTSYREAQRQDEDGATQAYLVFFWETTVYPKSVGPFDFGDIIVAWEYPVRLTRTVFGGWSPSGSNRHLKAAAELPKLMIKPIPLAGRPPDFNGAVGKFSINASAEPATVPVGDPITLTLTIRGDVAMERVGAPKLDQVQSLTKDFEISGEALAGELRADRKVFAQTIRALREDVTEIPPIPMSSFDPETGQYETVWSKAIPLQVLPAKRLTLARNSESGAGSLATLRPLVETTDGLQANYANVERMLVSQSEGLDDWEVGLLAAMPVLFLVTWFVTQRSTRFREDVAFRRRARAYASAKKALRRVGHTARPEEAGVLLIGYIADRCNVPVAGLIRTDAVSLLADRGVAPEMIRSVDGFLESLERAQYGGGAIDAAVNGSPGAIASEARHLLDALERYDLR